MPFNSGQSFTLQKLKYRAENTKQAIVIRLKMTAVYQQLQLDLNFSLSTSSKNHTALTELLTPSAF